MAKDTKKKPKTKIELEREIQALKREREFYWQVSRLYCEALDLLAKEQQPEDTDAWFVDLFDKLGAVKAKQENKNQGEN